MLSQHLPTILRVQAKIEIFTRTGRSLTMFLISSRVKYENINPFHLIFVIIVSFIHLVLLLIFLSFLMSLLLVENVSNYADLLKYIKVPIFSGKVHFERIRFNITQFYFILNCFINAGLHQHNAHVLQQLSRQHFH